MLGYLHVECKLGFKSSWINGIDQANHSSMYEHAMDDANHMSLCLMNKVKTNAQVYMHAMNQNPNSDTNKAAKVDSNQWIQEHKS